MLKKRLGVEAIERSWGEYFMYNYFKIPSSLTIPESVKRIGHWAFSGCLGLKEVVILNGCTNIECCAFKDCYNLEKIDIPESVEVIGDFAFKECEKLERIVAVGLLILKDYAFWGCRRLVDIIIPVNVKSEESAFRGCEKAEVKYRVKIKC